MLSIKRIQISRLLFIRMAGMYIVLFLLIHKSTLAYVSGGVCSLFQKMIAVDFHIVSGDEIEIFDNDIFHAVLLAFS